MIVDDIASPPYPYRVILADPPWTFMTRSSRGKGRSPEKHYSCMSLDEIKALPVAGLADKDCAMFLWTIDTHLPQALDLINAWGFTFKTKAFEWARLNKSGQGYFTGMGFWTRANSETCLLATRGKPKRVAKDVRRLIVSPRREHSRKPDEVYERIERLLRGPGIELFARQERAGWDSWGLESQKFNPE